MKATYLIRVNDELKAALLAAGPEHVRNTLAAAYCNTERVLQTERITKDRNTGKRNTKAVLQPTVEPVIQPDVLQPVVIQSEPEVVIQEDEPVIQEPALTLAERIAAGRAEVERKKAAKAALIAGLPSTMRSFVA